MDNTSGSTSCTLTCWIVAALGGAAAAMALMVAADWSFLQGAFIGVVVFIVGGFLLSWLFCKPLPAPGTVKIEAPIPGAAAPRPASKAKPAPQPAPEVVIKPSTPLAGEAELAERKGSWKYEGAAAPEAKTTASEPEAEQLAAKPEEKDDGVPGQESQPPTLTAPRDGGSDDLKLLKGVGPKLEQTLNELGFYHFDQIAGWTDAEVAWVDERLKFKGRIERDGWIEQAKILAEGGETEFSARKK